MDDIQSKVLLCPRNDEESLQILKLSTAIDLPTLVSDQAHGAKLSGEKDLLARLLEVNSDMKTLVIVEIPGVKEEEDLRKQGIEVVIIDHHRYDDLDRMSQQSSLEQFRKLFELNDTKLTELGFDPKMIAGVGAIDRGFLWELKNEDLNEDERKQAIAYYRSLTMELGGERREREEELAQIVWKNRVEDEGVIILRSDDDTTSVRDPLSFIVAENYPDHPPQTVIFQGSRRVYVQESEKARELYDTYGGFTFGRDACWGKMNDDEALPTQEEILKVLRS